MNALVGYDSSDDEIEVGGARTDRTRAISKYSESHPVAHSARPEHAEPTAHGIRVIWRSKIDRLLTMSI